jgi:dUTP pyrophosphatase
MIIETYLAVRRVGAQDLPPPAYAHPGDAGLDLRANVRAFSEAAFGAPGGREEDRLRILPWQRVVVPSGFAVALAPGLEGQVRPRSGVSLRTGLVVIVGTIDATYRGEVGILVANLSPETATITHGERIAQLVIAPALRAKVDLVDVLDETARGAGGFGSTGAY